MELHNDHESESTEVEALLDDLNDRAERLLGELKLFQLALREHGKQHESEIRVFRRGVQSEVKSLQTIRRRRTTHTNDEAVDDVTEHDLRFTHALKSSNLPFYEAVWKTAKSCRNITGLGRRVYCASHKRDTGGNVHTPPDDKQDAVVDVVADNGLKWIKVSTINNKRLLFEMAKQGWENYGDFSSEDEESDEAGISTAQRKDDNGQLELIKVAEVLVRAARSHRVCFKHPKVHFVLPNVCEGEYDDVDALLQDLRATGVLLNDHLDTPIQAQNAAELTTEAVGALLPTPRSAQQLTQTINLDCTILLALISDISHVSQADLPPHPTNRSGTYHRAILRQIDGEQTNPLLPRELYDLLNGRVLECTLLAADRMFKIVDTMGTELEKERAAVFFGREKYTGQSADQLRKDLSRMSCHAVPDKLNLPIHIIDFEDLSSLVHPPPKQDDDVHRLTTKTASNLRSTSMSSALDRDIAAQLTQRIALSKINTSVFLYGWTRDIVTLTSNKVVASNIHKTIDDLLDEMESRLQMELQTQTQSQTPTAAMQMQAEIQTQPDEDEGEGEGVNEFVGPKIYICETARSLIGKEKQTPPQDKSPS